jgi:hypothetical protein
MFGSKGFSRVEGFFLTDYRKYEMGLQIFHPPIQTRNKMGKINFGDSDWSGECVSNRIKRNSPDHYNALWTNIGSH